jgi:hypothetical protein
MCDAFVGLLLILRKCVDQNAKLLLIFYQFVSLHNKLNSVLIHVRKKILWKTVFSFVWTGRFCIYFFVYLNSEAQKLQSSDLFLYESVWVYKVEFFHFNFNEIFRTCPDRPWGHPASCTMGIGFLPGVECGRGVTLTPHPLLVPRSKNRVVLYLYSP